MVIKETCKECGPKVRRFCRGHGVAKNSMWCEHAQNQDYGAAMSISKNAIVRFMEKFKPKPPKEE